jgi:hypothetical protein
VKKTKEMPRAPSQNPRELRLSFRCTEQEANRLKNQARKSHLSLSDFVRARVLKARKSRNRAVLFSDLPTEDTGARELAHQVHKVGVNLNQIARLMNTFQAPPPEELHDILKQIRVYVRQANEL